MSKYIELDQLILARIKVRPVTFMELSRNHKIEDLADRLSKVNSHGNKMGWRLIDRRLQSLRKAGLIKYRSKQWTASP